MSVLGAGRIPGRDTALFSYVHQSQSIKSYCEGSIAQLPSQWMGSGASPLCFLVFL